MSKCQTFCESLMDLQITPEMEKEYDEFFDRVVRPRLSKKPKKENLIWVTINPAPTTKLGDFLGKLEKASTKAWIKTYWYNIEQRGETLETAGSGLHSHFLIISKNYKRISQVRDEFYNTFKSLIGNKKHVCVKSYPLSMLQDKIDYLEGKKWDDDKQTKIAVDNYFREKNKLPLLYNNNAV